MSWMSTFPNTTWSPEGASFPPDSMISLSSLSSLSFFLPPRCVKYLGQARYDSNAPLYFVVTALSYGPAKALTISEQYEDLYKTRRADEPSKAVGPDA